MRIRRFLAVSLATAAAAIAATPAQAAFCYEVQVTVNGDAIVDEADCQG